MNWPMYGYAFARLAEARGELKPAWINHLREDTKVFYKQSRKWIIKSQQA